MLAINTNQLANTNPDLIRIISSYKVLHFDEYPILFFGVNKLGNKVIASHLEEDDDEKKIQFLYTLISNDEYYDFVNQKKSYLQLLRDSGNTFLVETGFDNNLLNSFPIPFETIPQEYLPLEDSFCPKYERSYSLSFFMKLKGKLADVNKAIASDVSNIQTSFSDFLQERVAKLRGLNLKPLAYLRPYLAGSFKIELELQVEPQQIDMFANYSNIDKYVNQYIKYLTTSFIEDNELFINSKHVGFSDEFSELIAITESIYTSNHLPTSGIAKELIDDLEKASIKFEEITEVVGNNFETIEFSNVIENGEEFITVIDNKFSKEFHDSVEKIESSKSDITQDTDYKSYEIYIYHLNTDTRQGNAFIKDADNPKEMSKPKIKILGEEPLEQTKYTESLHLNKWITVSAKAKKKENKFKYLTIQMD